ncbi:hypothetical protein [Paludisphaera soli]|uniref:hypothetical protein n=1 Tax=Paludisphaera soli TaxID=2712865 RepID=UPI0013EBDB6E|nr:hypothetical protein [Paludisphaera soli]
MIRCGWSLWIRQVRPIPSGWWALVEVNPAARNEYYESMIVRDKLIEEYSFKDDRLTLERSYPDPDRKRDPTKGVYAVPAH